METHYTLKKYDKIKKNGKVSENLKKKSFVKKILEIYKQIWQTLDIRGVVFYINRTRGVRVDGVNHLSNIRSIRIKVKKNVAYNKGFQMNSNRGLKVIMKLFQTPVKIYLESCINQFKNQNFLKLSKILV